MVRCESKILRLATLYDKIKKMNKGDLNESEYAEIWASQKHYLLQRRAHNTR